MEPELYFHEGTGYEPFLIRPGWQVAQLRWAENLAFDGEGLKNVERHAHTDEVFVLQTGRAVLVTADLSTGKPRFHTQPMDRHKVYNIPQGLWHTLAVSRDCLILIVEKDNTHRGDVEYRWLAETERALLMAAVGANSLNPEP